MGDETGEACQYWKEIQEGDSESVVRGELPFQDCEGQEWEQRTS